MTSPLEEPEYEGCMGNFFDDEYKEISALLGEDARPCWACYEDVIGPSSILFCEECIEALVDTEHWAQSLLSERTAGITYIPCAQGERRKVENHPRRRRHLE